MVPGGFRGTRRSQGNLSCSQGRIGSRGIQGLSETQQGLRGIRGGLRNTLMGLSGSMELQQLERRFRECSEVFQRVSRKKKLQMPGAF